MLLFLLMCADQSSATRFGTQGGNKICNVKIV